MAWSGIISHRANYDQRSFENAIRVDLALGGSSNTVLHLLAIAHEAGVELPLEAFDVLGKDTPQLASMNPGGVNFMEDLDAAGGVLAVLYQLGDLIKDNPTLLGPGVKELVASVASVDEDVVHTMLHLFVLKVDWLCSKAILHLKVRLSSNRVSLNR